jgi:hypothetical protein
MTVPKVARPETLVGYDEDVLLWSQQQARLLREGRFSELDIEHLADEIEDVGKSEKRELSSRCAVLIAHLLKWRFQPSIRSGSWRATIRGQRERIEMALDETPSLKSLMREAKWRRGVWIDAREQAAKEMRLKKDILPIEPPWSVENALDPDFWPTA